MKKSKNLALYLCAMMMIATYALQSIESRAIAQTTITIQPSSADSRLKESSSSSNYGTATYMEFNAEMPDHRDRGIVIFDLSSIPSGATVTSATLALYLDYTDASSSATHNVHRVTESWTESGVSWDKRTSSNNWATSGGTFNSTPTASQTITTTEEFKTWDVTTDVQAFVNGTYSNYGWIVKDAEVVSSEKKWQYRTKEYSTASIRPKLTVSYWEKIVSTATGGFWSEGSTWVGGVVPSSYHSVEIVTGSTVTMDGNISRDAGTTLTVNGTLVCGTTTISGAGNFTLPSGGKLIIGSPNGITSSGASGNIQVTGTRSFSTSGNYHYYSCSAQVTGNGLPSTVNNLIFESCAGGITLTATTTVNGTLTLQQGTVSTGANILAVSSVGTTVRVTGYVIGNLKKYYSTTVLKTFEVGTANGYSPVDVDLTSTTGGVIITIKAVQGAHPNASGFVLQRYWVFSSYGIGTVNLKFMYLDPPDVTGSEPDYQVGRWSSGAWTILGGTIYPLLDYATVSGVQCVDGDFTLGEGGALPVELASFTGKLRAKNVDLTWETKTEVNNYGFDIERCMNIKQSLWEKIGFIQGHGTSNTPNTYSFTDVLDASQMNAEKIRYRLHQIDRDGTSSYSNVVEVYLAQPKAFSLEQNYPNPFGAGAYGNPSTTIQYSIPVDSRVILRVFDMYSREIATLKNEDQKAGHYSITFDANQLPSGTYFYRIEAGTFTKTMKMHLVR